MLNCKDYLPINSKVSKILYQGELHPTLCFGVALLCLTLPVLFGCTSLDSSSTREKNHVTVEDELASMDLQISKLMNQTNKVSSSESIHKQLEALERRLSPDHPSIHLLTSRLLDQRTDLAFAEENFQAAEEYARRSLELREAHSRGQNTALLGSLERLGRAIALQDRINDYIPIAERRLSILDANGMAFSFRTAIVLMAIGDAYISVQTYERAFHYYEEAIRRLTYHNYENHNETLEMRLKALSYIKLQYATLLESVHRWKEAADQAEEVIPIRKNVFGEIHQGVAGPYVYRARIAHSMGDLHKAQRYLNDAIDIYVQLPHTAFSLANARHGLGLILLDRGLPKEALQVFLVAIEGYRQYGGSYARYWISKATGLAAIALQQLGRIQEALDYIDTAVSLYLPYAGINQPLLRRDTQAFTSPRHKDEALQLIEACARMGQAGTSCLPAVFKLLQIAHGADTIAATRLILSNLAFRDGTAAFMLREFLSVTAQIEEVDRRLSIVTGQSDETTAIVSLKKSRDELYERRNTILGNLTQHAPKLSPLLSESIVPFDQVSSVLDNDELLLIYGISYSVGNSYVVAMSSDQIISRTLDTSDLEVQSLISQLRTVSGSTEQFSRISYQIFEKILEPVWPFVQKQQQKVSHLIIVPDSSLRDLPFAALVTSDGVVKLTFRLAQLLAGMPYSPYEDATIN